MRKFLILNRSYLPYLGCLLLLLATNSICYFFHSNFAMTHSLIILPLLFCLVVPGYLILNLLKIAQTVKFMTQLALSVVLSIAVLMGEGLLFNFLLQSLGIVRPIEMSTILIEIDTSYLILLILNFANHKPLVHNKISFSGQKTIPSLFLFTLILAIFGAIRLNNGANGILALSAAIMTTLLWAYLFLRKPKNLNYELVIFISSLTILLMWSLRSLHLSGGDIATEYAVFQNTMSTGAWHPNVIDTAYDACISITILPAYLAHIFNISGEYVFKVIYPVLFSFAPVLFYGTVKKVFNKTLALLSVFMFMAQSIFMYWMPMLARQEIGFLFFSAILYVLFNRILFTNRAARCLVLVLSFAMIISHYTTAYIGVATIIFVYLGDRFFDKSDHKKTLFLSTPLIVAIVLATFLWQAQVALNSKGLGSFIGKTISSTVSSTNGDVKNPATNKALSINAFNGSGEDQEGQLNIFVKQTSATFSQDNDYYYSDANSPKYKYDTNVAGSSIVPIKSPLLNSLGNYAEALVSLVLRGAVFIGLITLLVKRKRDKTNEGFIFATVFFTLLVTAFIILPFVSAAYNIERLYQQALFVIAPVTIIGIQTCLAPFKKINYVYVSGLILITLFIYTTGLLPQLVGGQASPLFNNYGGQYDSVYTHSAEVSAIQWLGVNRNASASVLADGYSSRLLGSYSNIRDVQTNLLAQKIPRNSYVFYSRANKIASLTLYYYQGKLIIFTPPTAFLNDNKNVVYSSGSSEVFK